MDRWPPEEKSSLLSSLFCSPGLWKAGFMDVKHRYLVPIAWNELLEQNFLAASSCNSAAVVLEKEWASAVPTIFPHAFRKCKNYWRGDQNGWTSDSLEGGQQLFHSLLLKVAISFSVTIGLALSSSVPQCCRAIQFWPLISCSCFDGSGNIASVLQLPESPLWFISTFQCLHSYLCNIPYLNENLDVFRHSLIVNEE